MDKQTALKKLEVVYNSIESKIDKYVDYIDNGKQWQEAVDVNSMYKSKSRKICRLIEILKTVTDKEEIEIRIKPENEERIFGKYKYTFNRYQLIVDGEILIEV